VASSDPGISGGSYSVHGTTYRRLWTEIFVLDLALCLGLFRRVLPSNHLGMVLLCRESLGGHVLGVRPVCRTDIDWRVRVRVVPGRIWYPLVGRSRIWVGHRPLTLRIGVMILLRHLDLTVWRLGVLRSLDRRSLGSDGMCERRRGVWGGGDIEAESIRLLPLKGRGTLLGNGGECSLRELLRIICRHVGLVGGESIPAVGGRRGG